MLTDDQNHYTCVYSNKIIEHFSLLKCFEDNY